MSYFGKMGGAASWKGSGKKGKKATGKKGTGPSGKKDWLRKVAWGDRLPKYFLRPYVDQTGSPFAGGSIEEKNLLSTSHLQTVLDEKCSEYCARQGVALSEGAANLEAGAALLGYHFVKDPKAAIQKLGIQELLDEFDSAEGKKFLEACRYLNTSNEDLERNQDATSQAVKRYLRFFMSQEGKKELCFKKLARFAARLYLFAFEGLEAITAINHPRVMAAGVQRVGTEYNLPSSSRTWLKKPDDQEAMLWSFVSAFHQQKVDSGKKRAASSLFEDWDEPVEDGHWTGGYANAWGYDDDEEGQEEEREAPKGVGNKRPRRGNIGKSAHPKDALASDEEDTAAEPIDLQSSPEPVPEVELELGDYSMEALEKLKTCLDEVANKDARERPPVSVLQEDLKAVPTSALRSLDLEVTVKAFCDKTRYPKTENLQKLLAVLQKMAASLEEALKAKPDTGDK